MVRALKHCIIAAVFHGWPEKSHSREKLIQWVNHAGGELTFTEVISKETTHFVCSSEWWTEHKSTFEIPQSHDNGLKVVTHQWLLETLINSKKAKASGTYLLHKTSKKSQREASHSSDSKELESDRSAGAVGNKVQLFEEHTDPFVNKRDLEDFERESKKQEAEERERAKEKEAEVLREKALQAKRSRESQALVRRGMRKARNEIFSDNHHIYRDTKGFPFEVTLTKIEPLTNKNLRVVITIFESNDEPHTYASNMYSAGTDTKPSNHILSGMGQSFLTARRAFTTAFKEHTEIDWEERLEKCRQSKTLVNLPYEQRPFIYRIPAYGPVGDEAGLPESAVCVEEPATAKVSNQSEQQEGLSANSMVE